MEKFFKLQPPWNAYVNKIKALLENDPEIRIEYNEATPAVMLYVENSVKADALQQLLGTEKTFGNVSLTITVIPANKEFEGKVDILEAALKGNPIVTQIESYDAFGDKMTFCEFKKEVIQFPNDDFSDRYGNYNGLAEDIAREIFVGAIIPQINYCTSID